jgi:hypothetical protein
MIAPDEIGDKPLFCAQSAARLGAKGCGGRLRQGGVDIGQSLVAAAFWTAEITDSLGES